MEDVIIATSIAPGKIELQQSAISSWLKLGFKVLSVNTRREIDLLLSDFPLVKFVEAERDASAVAGKPYIYFDDVLRALQAEGPAVCGIINSDIHLLAGAGFTEYIVENAFDGFIFGSRVDVDSLDFMYGEHYEEGFDFFFFNAEVIPVYPASDFCIGVPWWDYWAPLVPFLKGYPVKQLATSVAFHVKHPTKWSAELHEKFGDKFFNRFVEADLFAYGDENLTTAVDIYKSSSDFALGSILISNFIRQKAKIIFYEDSVLADNKPGVDAHQYVALIHKLLIYEKSFMLCRHDSAARLELIHQANKQLEDKELAYQGVISDMQQSLADMQLSFTEMQQMYTQIIESIKHSYSWKLTAPLRWLGDKLSRAKAK